MPTIEMFDGPKSPVSADDMLEAGVHTGGTLRIMADGLKVALKVSMVGGDAPEVLWMTISKALE